MKNIILSLLVATAMIFIFIGATKNKTISENLEEGNKISIASDSIIKGCWKRQLDSINYEMLSIPWIMESFQHQHFFYIEKYENNSCPLIYVQYWANRGIGSVDGMEFSFNFFGSSSSPDTSFQSGLITDSAGLKRMEVYSQTDTIVYYKQ